MSRWKVNIRDKPSRPWNPVSSSRSGPRGVVTFIERLRCVYGCEATAAAADLAMDQGVGALLTP